MDRHFDREASWRVIDALRLQVADLFDDLPREQWATRSLCDAWTVRDVGAHLSLAALTPLREVLGFAVRSGFRFDPMIREATLARARSRTDAEVVSDLRSLVGNRRLAPGTLWRDPLLDVLVHAQDIARPLGIPAPEDPRAAAVAAEWAWARAFPFFPGRRLKGLRLVATDVDWSRGSGEEVHGPVTSLLLLSVGRRTAFDELGGPGADRARAAAAR